MKQQVAGFLALHWGWGEGKFVNKSCMVASFSCVFAVVGTSRLGSSTRTLSSGSSSTVSSI